jgi:hypothetical protein
MVRLENILAEIRILIMSLSNYILFFSLFIIYFISNSLSIITPLYLSHIGLELYIVGSLVSVAPLFRFLLLATLYGRVMERVSPAILPTLRPPRCPNQLGAVDQRPGLYMSLADGLPLM